MKINCEIPDCIETFSVITFTHLDDLLPSAKPVVICRKHFNKFYDALKPDLGIKNET